jgi:hypothetical protein
MNDEKRLMQMIIGSNILAAYYSAKTSFCVVNQKEPDTQEKEKLLQNVISAFENLTTSYMKDIEDIAESIR